MAAKYKFLVGWPVKIRPVFEQNTEIVEDCKARFEDNLSKKSEWISKELEKLSARVQELEELGEIGNVQQYTYVSTRIFKILEILGIQICFLKKSIFGATFLKWCFLSPRCYCLNASRRSLCGVF